MQQTPSYDILPVFTQDTINQHNLLCTPQSMLNGFVSNDCTFLICFPVIDFMLTKCMVRDLETNFQCLRLNWASKANAIQRRGKPFFS